MLVGLSFPKETVMTARKQYKTRKSKTVIVKGTAASFPHVRKVGTYTRAN